MNRNIGSETAIRRKAKLTVEQQEGKSDHTWDSGKAFRIAKDSLESKARVNRTFRLLKLDFHNWYAVVTLVFSAHLSMILCFKTLR